MSYCYRAVVGCHGGKFHHAQSHTRYCFLFCSSHGLIFLSLSSPSWQTRKIVNMVWHSLIINLIGLVGREKEMRVPTSCATRYKFTYHRHQPTVTYNFSQSHRQNYHMPSSKHNNQTYSQNTKQSIRSVTFPAKAQMVIPPRIFAAQTCSWVEPR